MEKWREEQRLAKKDDVNYSANINIQEIKDCTFQPNIKYHKSQERDPEFVISLPLI